MFLTLGHTLPVTFISVYMPTAARDTATKEAAYRRLKSLQQKKQRKGPTYVAGDFNARVQVKNSSTEECVGPHTFDKHHITLGSQDDSVRESRTLLVSHCATTKAQFANTFFDKPSENLATHRTIQTNMGPPWTRGRYETIDY
eukprot:9478384-Pyramimonas_sp.AAC.1